MRDKVRHMLRYLAMLGTVLLCFLAVFLANGCTAVHVEVSNPGEIVIERAQ